MRIDLPLCDFNKCRYYFDGNCTKKSEYERCEYLLAKSEAIKEFAERLKANISYMEYTANVKRKTIPIETLFTQANWLLHEIVPETIDKLVKEMTEVEDVEKRSV